ncbi:TIR domain-containing protein [Frankia sp. CiP3]|uniref:nSTAND1 domain-containing NTPase n=1 Tax=Frankia sp. CiP3 TaxID=2880971 RepID=UPI001EF485E6|nr:TIR domain-containing protein [Frankia sp. CiP3]
MATGTGTSVDARASDGGLDFFVSYAEADQAWAEWIAWQMENASYRVVLQAWDFRAGSHRIQQLHQATARAVRTVAVLSAAYLTSAYGEAAWQAAWDTDPSGAQRRLLTVRVEDCPRPGLLGHLIGVDLFGIDQQTARQRLLAAVAGDRTKPSHPPVFPGSRPGEDERRPPRFPGPSEGWEAVWQPGRSPFPGLAAFDASRARVFHGRDEDTRLLVNRLDSPRGESAGLLVVVGPSGCGKSSLVAAGLAPRLASDPDWLVLRPMTPGGRPLATLARVLAAAGQQQGLGWDADALLGRLAAEPGTVAEIAAEVLGALDPPARRLLLVIDQAEELLVRNGTADQERFFAVVAAATAGPVRVVATVRSEYLDRLIATAAPAGVRVRAEVLHPLSRDLLRLVITGPARLAGLTVDDELVARMVADTGDGQALPLLAYTLQRLYAQAHAAGTTMLSAAVYAATGGVRGALVDHADAALGEAAIVTGHTDDQVLTGLLRLITVDIDGHPTRRRVPLDELPDPVRAQWTPFVARRLLAVDATPGGPVTVEVTHERLLTTWNPLADAMERAGDRLRQRSHAETAANNWQRGGRPHSRLWNLALASSTLTALHPDELTPAIHAFLTASRRHARRRLASAFTLLTVLLLITTSFGITAYLQRRTAEARRRSAVVDRLLTLADNTRTDDPTTALRLGIAADSIASPSQHDRIHGNLVETLANSPYLHAPLTGHTGWVYGVAFGPGGLLASASLDRTVRLWDISDPVHPHPMGEPLTGHTSWVYGVAFGPGGLLASASFDRTVRLWDISDPAHPHPIGGPLTGHADAVSGVAFGPRGLLASASLDRTVRLWDISDPAHPTP